ncbi:hypothetical protein H4R18_002610 [Coemansia javaensis]|uniref:HCP-like protein n=1 Tax=Coemansia javaensis TaxID=2761396 RepID=A0A9W8HH53_9FUNG|nr:hypothetical protein H4R18_002610 [Coemansia javaensis]
MDFFRKALGRRERHEPASASHDHRGAGGRVAEQTLARQYGSPGAAPASASASAHSGGGGGGDDDFDDAASYHSITSSQDPDGRGGAFPQTVSSRYAGATYPQATAPGSRRSGYPGEWRAQSPARSGHGAFPPAAARSGGGAKPATDAAAAPDQGVELFQKAVRFHEEGDLVSATAYFKRAADRQNPLGMLFYGLSLRHGWGCQANEHLAFVFLQKAGEIVVPQVKDMDPAVAGMAREELAMAIYELGQSYRHGWGVSQNKKTAAYYFEVAADLGDADAQADVAACYEKGDGVKRDMRRAAHYYRLAHSQGVRLFGTSWIFKKKYESD